ncbi:MAG TPA: YggS family pyridoxal phosphate-dependent enzyme [Candidatus Xenobia bacterium]|nr:YggS family pyridoxal phosphate-dependent enzyme [Candidatus Xenobia bacterium]
MPERATLSIAENLAAVQERMAAALRRAGRRDEVTLVGVTKQVPVERIAEAYRAGLRHFGENRVQEFEEKHRFLVLPSAIWHMVGHLQSNKAARAAQLFNCIDSVDSLHLARKLSGASAGRKIPVLLQVHLGNEPSKHGIDPEQLVSLAEQMAVLPGLSIEGLMTIPPFLEPPERVRPHFRRLRELAEELEHRNLPGAGMQRLSMGMSHDFEIAIEEGATEIRLGTALFGPRPAKGIKPQVNADKRG